jgi:heme A synthase
MNKLLNGVKTVSESIPIAIGLLWTTLLLVLNVMFMWNVATGLHQAIEGSTFMQCITLLAMSSVMTIVAPQLHSLNNPSKNQWDKQEITLFRLLLSLAVVIQCYSFWKVTNSNMKASVIEITVVNTALGIVIDVLLGLNASMILDKNSVPVTKPSSTTVSKATSSEITTTAPTSSIKSSTPPK